MEGYLAKLVISDGIVLVRLNPVQRFLLQRPHIAFELDRMVGIYVQKSPKRRDLGTKASKGWFFWSKTAEYQDGVKKTLYLGKRRGQAVRVLLLNPAFDEFLLGGQKAEEIAFLLRTFLKKHDFSQK
jgi:hypothetical protein